MNERRRSRAGVVLAGLVVALLASGHAAEAFTGRVVGVTDGDTIKVLTNGRAQVIGLRGIDAPEKGQAYGARAKEFAATLAFGQTVTAQAAGRDRYGRVLADVILPDGRQLNQELVRAGYAWWFRRYSADPRLAILETEARASHLGLWADPHPTSPWEWRRSRHERPPQSGTVRGSRFP